MGPAFQVQKPQVVVVMVVVAAAAVAVAASVNITVLLYNVQNLMQIIII